MWGLDFDWHHLWPFNVHIDSPKWAGPGHDLKLHAPSDFFYGIQARMTFSCWSAVNNNSLTHPQMRRQILGGQSFHWMFGKTVAYRSSKTVYLEVLWSRGWAWIFQPSVLMPNYINLSVSKIAPTIRGLHVNQQNGIHVFSTVRFTQSDRHFVGGLFQETASLASRWSRPHVYCHLLAPLLRNRMLM